MLIGLTLRSTEARESLGLREACRFAAELGTAGTGMNFSYGLPSSVMDASGDLLWGCFKGTDPSPGTAGKALRDGGTSQPLFTFAFSITFFCLTSFSFSTPFFSSTFFWSTPNDPAKPFFEVLVATTSLEE